ncbi:MAG TPA: hypothetical protein VNA25_14365 [Phycisphaerae bacterium]|nr:hypothetical protein [Phycisphaerae bacterium]
MAQKDLGADARFPVWMALGVTVMFGLKLMDYNIVTPYLTNLVYYPRPLKMGNWVFFFAAVVGVGYYLLLSCVKHPGWRSVLPGVFAMLVTGVVSAFHLSSTYSRFYPGMLFFMIQVCLIAGVASWVRYSERPIDSVRPEDRSDWIKAQLSLWSTVTGAAILGLLWLTVPWIGELRKTAESLATCAQDRQAVLNVLHAQMWATILFALFGPIGQCMRRIRRLSDALAP